MYAKELRGRGRRPFSLFLVLASLLVLSAFGERALLAAPVPQVSFSPGNPPDVPPEVLIGEDFTFKVRFKNASTSPGDIGYGPFIDVVVDAGGANITKPAQTPACLCDGMTVLTANMIDVNGGPVPLVSYQSVASPCTSPLPVSPNHPFQSSLVPPVTLPAGSQLVTIELPFGSFDSTQPEIVVEVTAHVSHLADVTPPYPLKIYARGGFRYGLDALDNPSVDPPILSDVSANSTQWVANEQTTPTLMIVSKKYLGPEDETATGPNFIRRYEITLDVATLQTVFKLKVTDHLPNNVAYHQMVSAPPCFLPPTLEPTPPNQANNSPDNDLVLTCDPLTGVPGPDATIVFEFFIPELDANGQPVLSTSCAFAQSINDVKAEGNWTPIDVCDNPGHVVSDATATDHALADKCLAIQKRVADLSGGPPAHPIPGDTLQYTLDFQLSDFRTAGSLHVQDILSDGQTLLPASLMLTVTDQCGTTLGVIPPAAWTQTSLSCSVVAPPPPPRTKLDIDVSAAMSILATASGGPPRHQSGILTGGYAATLPSNVPATGRITFQTVIDDAYQCPVASPHDQFVDKDDPLNNAVDLTAAILPNGGPCSTIPSPPIGVIAGDNSTVAFLIATDFLEKTVYAIHRPNSPSPNICGPNATYTTTPCPSNPEVIPFDEVTFRLKKTIPSGDAETLTIQDWLPLPTFLVAGGPFSNSQCGIPAVGDSCLGPDNTLPVVPTYTGDGLTNSFTFDYGTFSNSANQPQTIDLLFTRTVTNTPFADGLYMTNEAQECESNSFGVIFCQTAIAQVHVREPALKITKGVVAASNPNAVFSPPQAGPVTFQPPGASCPRFNGTIDSTNLAAAPIDSDISSVDANDCITFAIVVENTGGSTAYDIELRDLFPLGPTDLLECFAPDFTTLCATDGTGAPVPFTSGPGRGSATISLQNPLPGVTSTPGSNIVVITFDACIIGDIKPHCCDNTAVVENYASTQGGPNFVAAGFGGPFQDSAEVCVRPTATKSIQITSEAHTSETTVPRPLAIGEIIRYRLAVVVPETASPSSYTLTDLLPAGLRFFNDNTTRLAFLSNGSGISSSTLGTLPLVSGNQLSLPNITPTFLLLQSAISVASGNCGSPPSFALGNLTNSDNDADQELIVLEFNALVCNLASNQNGTALNNSFGVFVDGQQVATSNTVTAVVVEPNLTIAKTVSPNPVVLGGTVTYTVTITNNGAATAFDVAFADTLPGGLTPVPNSLTGPPGWTGGINGQNVNLTCNSPTCSGVPAGGPPLTIAYQAVAGPATCPVTLTNRARVTWTSLPGPQGTTTNPTGSSTPGNSGAFDGERDGSTAPALLNDYAAITAAPLAVDCPPCAPPPTDMVAWWPLDETSGTVVADIIGNNNGTAMTGPIGGGNGPVSHPGKVNTALTLCNALPGPPSFVTVPDNQVLNFGTAQSFSIDAWTFGGGATMIVDKLNSPNPSGGYRFYLRDSSNRLKLDIGNGSFTGTTAMPPFTWSHVAVTVDRGSPSRVTFYVNGTPEVAAGNPSSLNASSPGLNLLIGGTYDAQLPAGCESGVDEIEIFNRVLFQPEIQSIANAGSAGKCKCLLVSNEKIDCHPNGTFTHTFTVTNSSNSTVSGVTFSPPAGVTITPGSITIPSLAPGASTTVTVTISGSGAVSGTTFCFSVALVGQGAVSCRIDHCVTLPRCCFPPPPDMVSWWRAESNTSDSADGNHGVLQGNAGFAPGMVGSAFSLAAQGDYVSVPNSANLNFGNAVSSPGLSIDAWIKTSSSAQVLPIVDKRDLSGGPLGYSLFLFNGNLALQLGDGTFFNYISSGPDLRNGQFHHVAVTVDRTSPTGAKLYVDGALVSPVFNPMNRPGTLTNNRPLFIGQHATDPTGTFIGLIDEVEIFNRVLSQAEIQGIFNAGPAGKCHNGRRRAVRH